MIQLLVNEVMRDTQMKHTTITSNCLLLCEWIRDFKGKEIDERIPEWGSGETLSNFFPANCTHIYLYVGKSPRCKLCYLLEYKDNISARAFPIRDFLTYKGELKNIDI